MREKCSLTPNLKRMRVIHPGIFGGDDGSGEYSKCVALPMVTWARVGLDMRNRDFLRNSAAAMELQRANLLEDFQQFFFLTP